MSDQFGKRAKLIDCREPGQNAELLIVEGDSAANAVAAVRNEAHQAVLPMQGKILNVLHASPAKVRKNPFCGALLQALGCQDPADPTDAPLRYGRVVLLADPDVDGMHTRVLLLMFFERYFPKWIREQRLIVATPPVVRIDLPPPHPPRLVHRREDVENILDQIQQEGLSVVRVAYSRSLGQMDARTLAEYAVHPQTRVQTVLRADAGEQAIRAFTAMQADLRASVDKTWDGHRS